MIGEHKITHRGFFCVWISVVNEMDFLVIIECIYDIWIPKWLSGCFREQLWINLRWVVRWWWLGCMELFVGASRIEEGRNPEERNWIGGFINAVCRYGPIISSLILTMRLKFLYYYLLFHCSCRRAIGYIGGITFNFCVWDSYGILEWILHIVWWDVNHIFMADVSCWVTVIPLKCVVSISSSEEGHVLITVWCRIITVSHPLCRGGVCFVNHSVMSRLRSASIVSYYFSPIEDDMLC